ncbi:pectin lyase-like protein [Setomelanomma holmii]|uniref:Pectin lyase-like protein n=1 Tax=Setomelanomma holmii TaxID=210430 RepID=A0A9P4H8N1_9PLEO|nr:pectin lyase-like protein [Setomelanomma holmii]
MRMITLSAALAALTASGNAKEIYVSPTGTGTGTSTSPYGSIQSAVNAAAAGDVIYLRAGTYKPNTNIQIKKSGTRTQPMILRSYTKEKVILDGESLPGTPYELDASLPKAERGILHIEGGNYWKFYNLELTNGPYSVYARDASHNYYELLSTHDNYESGFKLQGASSNNTVIYLDSYRNRDPRKNSQSADGFACKEGSGEGNSLRNARLWDNVEGGLDLYMFGKPVTMEEVYAWGNGFNRWGFSDFNGDGNGFKLGITDNPPANHIIRNFRWLSRMPRRASSTMATQALTANIAVAIAGSQVSLTDSGILASGNSWNSGTWSNSSFKSVDPSTLKGARGADGRVPASDFLIPVSGAAIGATTRADM